MRPSVDRLPILQPETEPYDNRRSESDGDLDIEDDPQGESPPWHSISIGKSENPHLGLPIEASKASYPPFPSQHKSQSVFISVYPWLMILSPAAGTPPPPTVAKSPTR